MKKKGCGKPPEERLKKQPDLLPDEGKFCHNVSNNHPPVCGGARDNSCLNCSYFLDGICDKIPWVNMTDDEKTLIHLYKKRDAWYTELDPIYKKIHDLDDPINEYLGKVRKAQGR